MPASNFTRNEWLILAAFVVVGLVNVLMHDIWRDEFQAFLIAKESVSIPDMLERMKYEGHPPLWHTLLFFLTRVSDRPPAMQLLHMLIACASAWVIMRFPLPLWMRALMVFGYFPVFEFMVISRNYGIGFLLCMVLLFLITAERKRYVLISFLLALLSLANVYGIILTAAVVVYLATELIEKKELRAAAGKRAMTAAAIVLGAGVVLSLLAIAPPRNSYIELPVCLPLELDPKRISHAVRTVWISYVPIPMFKMQFWGTNFLELRFARFFLALPLIAGSLFIFRSDRRVLTFYALGTAAVIAFCYFVFIGHMRHFGHLYIVFMMSLVLAYAHRPQGKNKVFPGGRFGQGFVMFILVAQLIGGVLSSFLSWHFPFTAGKAVADYIRQQKLEDRIIIGDRDWALTTVAGHLGKPLYHLTSRKYATYVVWDSERAEIMTPEQILEAAHAMQRRAGRRALVVLNYELEPEYLGDFRLVKTFTRSIMPDEVFFLYEIDPGISEEPAPRPAAPVRPDARLFSVSRR